MPTKEQIWVDAWVRWEKNSKEVYNAPSDDERTDDEDKEEEEDEELPPPTESYTFSYPNPYASNDADNGGDVIKLEIKGFHSDSEQTWNSTGLTMWESSHHLCEYLVDQADTLLPQDPSANLRILEVGSGLGRCGLLAHHLSHENATTVLTDGDTDTLKQLRENVQHNAKVEDEGNILSKQLLWGEKYAQSFLLNEQPEENDERKFDFILGSDLIYVQSVIRPLFETVRILLNDKKDSKFLMAHCARREGNEVDLHMVLDVADKEGFTYEEVIKDGDISVFVFQRKS